MDKINVYVDFDNTIVDTNQSAVKMLNKIYHKNQDYRDVYRYDFKDLFPECNDAIIEYIFSQEELFNSIKLFDGCVDILSNENLNVKIISVGTMKNLDLKNIWLKNNFNVKTQLIGFEDKQTDKEKSVIDMSNQVFIDDRIAVLRNSNAKIKILYRNGTDVSWNHISPNEECYVVDTWEEIGEILNFYIKNGGII